MTTFYDTFEMTAFSTVSFTKDLVPPRISDLSPQNKTYATSDVELDFTVSENVSQILYCLDGNENKTLTGNMTLTGLTKGEHNVTLFVADLAGNAASSKTLFFRVDVPESFPILPVTAASVAVALLVASLLVYHKKHKHNSVKEV